MATLTPTLIVENVESDWLIATASFAMWQQLEHRLRSVSVIVYLALVLQCVWCFRSH